MRKFQSENNNTCLVVMVTTSSSFCAAALTLAPESLKLKIKRFIQGRMQNRQCVYFETGAKRSEGHFGFKCTEWNMGRSPKTT